MEISALTLKLIIILTPGIIATLIYEKLTDRKDQRDQFRLVLLSVISGFACYFILQILYYAYLKLAGNQDPAVVPLDTFKALSNSANIPFEEALFASLIALPVAYMLAWMRNTYIFNRLGRKLRITKVFSDNGVFTDYLAGDIEWVYLRDLTKKLTYKGYLKTINEKGLVKELVLRKVTVYNYEDSEELYQVDEIYLCFHSDNFTIERATLLKNIEHGREQQPHPAAKAGN